MSMYSSGHRSVVLQPGPDGTCYTHLVKEGDTCWSLSEAHQSTIQVIEDSNKKTWGWAGCDGIQWGLNICLGRGTIT
jgi:chitinase